MVDTRADAKYLRPGLIQNEFKDRSGSQRLFKSGSDRGGAPSGQIPHTICFRVLFVQGPGRNDAGIARPISAAIIAEDERDGTIQHKQPSVEFVRVRCTMLVGLDFALADLIAAAPQIGFELGSGHGVYPHCERRTVDFDARGSQ